jgi:hypothetical protein
LVPAGKSAVPLSRAFLLISIKKLLITIRNINMLAQLSEKWLRHVCICKAVADKAIKQAIADGAASMRKY